MFVQTYCLRSIFDAKGIHLNEEVDISIDSGIVRFVKSVSLHVVEIDTVRESPDGKVGVEMAGGDKIFKGNPFLVEMMVFTDVDDEADIVDVRRQLESRREEVVSLLHWASPGTLNRLLANALFRRNPDRANEWVWAHSLAQIVAPFYNQPFKLQQCLVQQAEALMKLSADRDVVSMSLRWLQRADYSETPIDQFICFWVILEILSSRLSKKDSIRARLGETVEILYPVMNKNRCKALCDLLYRTRNKSIHGGFREIPSLAIISVAAGEMVRSGIQHILDKSLPPPLDKNLLDRLLA